MESVRRPPEGGGGPADPADPGAGSGAPAKPAAKPAARTLPAAEPGPTIRKPAGTAGQSLARPPLVRSKGKTGRPRKDGSSAPPAGSSAPIGATAVAPPRRGSSADGVFKAHERAARWLHLPMIQLTADEARDVADALNQAGDLTGWRPSGPLWTWLTVAGTLGAVYGTKVWELVELRRQALARAAQQPPGRPPGAAPAPGAPPRAPAPSPGPAPAAAPAAAHPPPQAHRVDPASPFAFPDLTGVNIRPPPNGAGAGISTWEERRDNL